MSVQSRLERSASESRELIEMLRSNNGSLNKAVDATIWSVIGYLSGYLFLIGGGIVIFLFPKSGGMFMAYVLLAMIVAFIVLLVEMIIGRKTAIAVFLFIAYKIIKYNFF